MDTEKPASSSEPETRPESPSSRPKLFSTSERAPSHFVPKVKQNSDAPTTTTTSTTLTTSTTTAASTDETTRKKTFGKDLLSSIPIEDDVSALLPPGYVPQPETSSVGIVQVSQRDHRNLPLMYLEYKRNINHKQKGLFTTFLEMG